MQPKLKLNICCLLAFVLYVTIVIVPRSNDISFSLPKPPKHSRSFILWFHGLEGSGSALESIKLHFTSSEFNNTEWSFPSAPNQPVTCRNGDVFPSWFDIQELPITSHSPQNESSLLEAVGSIHTMLDKVIDSGTNPSKIFVCGFGQGAALTLASVLLYPKSLGGGVVFGGWVPFGQSLLQKITPEAKKTPILWQHGKNDDIVLFEAAQDGCRAITQAGIKCELKAYAGLRHIITNEELKLLQIWIKSRLYISP